MPCCKRRLGQYFYNTPLSLAVSLGRAKDGRRDERILFAALTRAEAFTPWLDALREAEAILAGVYSVPLVLAQFGTQILDAKGPALLLTLTRGGVRQTFFDQGKLHFSRLSQLATRGSRRNRPGLRQRFGQDLPVPRCPTPDSARQRPAHRNTRRGQARCANPAGLLPELAGNPVRVRRPWRRRAESFASRIPCEDSNADSLLMHCVASKPPAQQFAPPEETRFHRLWKMRSAITGTALGDLCRLLAVRGQDRAQGGRTPQSGRNHPPCNRRRHAAL
jgi:hypothetical protein